MTTNVNTMYSIIAKRWLIVNLQSEIGILRDVWLINFLQFFTRSFLLTLHLFCYAFLLKFYLWNFFHIIANKICSDLNFISKQFWQQFRTLLSHLNIFICKSQLVHSELFHNKSIYIDVFICDLYFQND